MVLGIGSPTPTPPSRQGTPGAGINWKMFLLVVGIVTAAFIIGTMMNEGNGITKLADNVHSTDIGQSSGPGSSPVAVETETRKTSVPVKHLTKKEFQRFAEGKADIKEKVLYLYEYKDTNDPTYSMPVGFILLNKNKLSGLEFDFEGIHLSNFSPEFREDEKDSVIISVDTEKSGYQTVEWNAWLSDSNKNRLESSNVDQDGKLNIWFSRYNWEKGKFIFIEMRVVDGIVTTAQ